MRLLELKNTSRPLFDWKLQIITFLVEKHSQKVLREACGHFRRPLENEVATQRILQCGKRNARYLLRCQRHPSQIWSEAKRFMRLLELKNTSRPLFDWKL